MLGTGLQFGKVSGEDRFYIPVKARKGQNGGVLGSKQNQHQQQQKQNKANCEKEENGGGSPLAPNDAVSKRSNLERFLESTKPSVPAQYFSKTTLRGLKTCDVEFQPYFVLCDLWESFREWSAYGVGVPLVLDESDCVVQYYVPYLSGIQLFGESTTSTNTKSRQGGGDSDGDYRDSTSDGSSDYEFEKGMKVSRELQGTYPLPSEIPFRLGSLSISDEQSMTQEGYSSDEGEAGNPQRCLLFEFLEQDTPHSLLFEFLEQDTPYSPEPLVDKILGLACQYPGLNSLRSCDLLPVSWMSIAWYPIYRIPTGPTLKDLDTCFLTYHSLSTPLEGGGSTPAPVVVYPNELDGVPKVSLPVFGMASYKFKGLMWTQNEMSELQLANSLAQAADSWLRLLQVNHPDFQFFSSHG